MKYKIIATAAGPCCSNCGKGFRCWLAPDESPCKCLIKHFNKNDIKKWFKHK